jgi:lipopolysaccharide/colanic/teichoic acid biosynthesis glycosyltransferase
MALAGLGLILTMPLQLVIALLVKLTSPGPVLYAQTRVGLDRRHPAQRDGGARRAWDYGGRPFTLYRFRTQRVNGGRHGGAVTPVGRVLRRLDLDDLPQLFNVLRGDMNLVGPRPERPQIVEHLSRRIRGYRARQRVLPGITGWAQVHGSPNRGFDDVRRRVALDLEYVARQSVSDDLRIMARGLRLALLPLRRPAPVHQVS